MLYRNLTPLYLPLPEMCPNAEFFLVRIFWYLDQKKLRIWTLFTQCVGFILLMFLVIIHRDVFIPLSNTLHKKWSFPLRISAVISLFLSSFLQIWSCLLKNSLMENFIFCAVYDKVFFQPINYFHNKDHVLKGSKFASDLTVPIKE